MPAPSSAVCVCACLFSLHRVTDTRPRMETTVPWCDRHAPWVYLLLTIRERRSRGCVRPGPLLAHAQRMQHLHPCRGQRGRCAAAAGAWPLRKAGSVSMPAKRPCREAPASRPVVHILRGPAESVAGVGRIQEGTRHGEAVADAAAPAAGLRGRPARPWAQRFPAVSGRDHSWRAMGARPAPPVGRGEPAVSPPRSTVSTSTGKAA